MRITFTQSGGFVGAFKGCELDTATLAPEDRREVEALVAGSGLTESSERSSAVARDQRQFEIVLEADSGRVQIVSDEGSLPEAARPLVAFLVARARPKHPGHEGRF
ncbi:MAG: protealysin inhibitor emfourin [Planctomycetota bacterium]